MTQAAPIAPHVQDRIQSLLRLIETHLVGGGEITVIARSLDSPVMLAIEAARSTIAAAKVSLRAVILTGAVGDWGQSLPDEAARDIRLASNPRLLEAHEQLVVAGGVVWIGDCMRREPTKRDALSREKVGCHVTSRFAVLSFEKLWAIGMPAVAPLAAATSAIGMPTSEIAR